LEGFFNFGIFFLKKKSRRPFFIARFILKNFNLKIKSLKNKILTKICLVFFVPINKILNSFIVEFCVVIIEDDGAVVKLLFCSLPAVVGLGVAGGCVATGDCNGTGEEDILFSICFLDGFFFDLVDKFYFNNFSFNFKNDAN
jgi:hypothetical protein